jgi:oligopeptide/dipeptide ABC transporter ATP-binding protein
MSLLSISDLRVHLPTTRGVVHAVNGVDLEIDSAETVGLIGESGCGKSTLAKAIMRIVASTSGSIVLDGIDITGLGRKALKPIRPKLQMIFQDNASALNPRHSIGYSIGQPLALAGWSSAKIAARVDELLGLVGLTPDMRDRTPHEFSGGQRQRIGIARAIALNPKLIICDEPVSALDVSIRAQVINLLSDLQQRLGVSYLFVSHDLAVVEHIADRIVVMYLGHVVETGSRANFWAQPLHPYTRALLDAVPLADPRGMRNKRRTVLPGELPSALHLPSGCPFHSRCPFAEQRCREERPVLRRAPSGSHVACHLVADPEIPAANI